MWTHTISSEVDRSGLFVPPSGQTFVSKSIANSSLWDVLSQFSRATAAIDTVNPYSSANSYLHNTQEMDTTSPKRSRHSHGELNRSDRTPYGSAVISSTEVETKSASHKLPHDLLGYFNNVPSEYASPYGDSALSINGSVTNGLSVISEAFMSDGTNKTDLLYDTTLNATEDPLPDGYISGYTLEHVVIASILVTALMVIIVLGNGLVIVAIGVDRNLKGVQNWFIASLALSDLLVGLLIMPFSLANELMGYWPFGQILCELWLATDVLLCTASILNLCLISLDRYWSITRAISYVKTRTSRRAVIMIGIVWGLSMIICFPPLVGWKRPQPFTEKFNLPKCQLSDDLGYVVYSTLGSFYIPLIVMVVVYFKIYLAARSRARKNLTKQKPMGMITTAGNGKSTTTTSFSTPLRERDKKPAAADDLNSDVDDDVPSSYDCRSDAPCYNPNGQTNRLTVPLAQGTVVDNATTNRLIEDKRKLLGDETDSATEMNASQPGDRLVKTNKQSPWAEDTDSSVDVRLNENMNHYERDGHKHDENSRPLLGDPAQDSDVQLVPKLENNNSNTGSAARDGPINNPVVKQLPQAARMHTLSPESEPDSNRRPSFAPRKISLGMRKMLSSSHNNVTSRDKHKRTENDPERLKRRLARARERRATIVLGIIMLTFIMCWLPFFSSYLISSIFKLSIPKVVFAVFFWAGYCNSALNPIIYTIFNQDFRKAFVKLIFRRRGY